MATLWKEELNVENPGSSGPSGRNEETTVVVERRGQKGAKRQPGVMDSARLQVVGCGPGDGGLTKGAVPPNALLSAEQLGSSLCPPHPHPPAVMTPP